MSSSDRSTPFGFTLPVAMNPSRLPLRDNKFYRKYERCTEINNGKCVLQRVCPCYMQATAELRQAWINSAKRESLGNRLPVRQLPICVLRQQAAARRIHCNHSDPYYWVSDHDKRKLVDKRKHFDRQWSGEISKRNDTVRPAYTIAIRPSTPPRRKLMTAPCINSGTHFRQADTHRPKTREERHTSSRHFISPEWKSEMVSWKRFNETSLDIHRLSLF